MRWLTFLFLLILSSTIFCQSHIVDSLKLELDNRSQELEIEKQKQTRNKILGGGIILLLLSTSIGQWYYHKQKIKKKEAQQELKLQQHQKIKLKELNEMKSQFFTNVSHELLTPLTLISGPLQNVIPKLKDAAIKEDVKLAHSNSRKLLSLINEILDLSKLERGEISLEKISFDLDNTIKRIFYAFKSLADMRDISLKYKSQIEADLYCIQDQNKFEKILNNLISNAIKFSSHNSQVIMDVALKNSTLILSVLDSGEGINESELDNIFDRFYQSKDVKSPVGGGMGIGLAISKEYAELMGGGITVESSQENGSVFTLSLPLDISDFQANEAKTKSDPTEKENIPYSPILIDGEKLSILIVEDNADMSNYIKQILSKYYHCSFAIDGYEAIKMVQKEKFALISSDVMMPRMDGFRLKEKINELDQIHKIPFIFLTAKALKEDKLKGLSLGVDDYITKPFNKNEYLVRIHNLLKNKKMREKWIKESEGLFTSEEKDSTDLKTIKEAEKIVLKNMSNPSFKIIDLAKELNSNQRQLSRVVKKLSGLPLVGFILEIRLQKAYHLLKLKQYHTVSEVRYEVGIESASYFTNKFKHRFGLNPTDIL